MEKNKNKEVLKKQELDKLIEETGALFDEIIMEIHRFSGYDCDFIYFYSYFENGLTTFHPIIEKNNITYRLQDLSDNWKKIGELLKFGSMKIEAIASVLENHKKTIPKSITYSYNVEDDTFTYDYTYEALPENKDELYDKWLKNIKYGHYKEIERNKPLVSNLFEISEEDRSSFLEEASYIFQNIFAEVLDFTNQDCEGVHIYIENTKDYTRSFTLIQRNQELHILKDIDNDNLKIEKLHEKNDLNFDKLNNACIKYGLPIPLQVTISHNTKTKENNFHINFNKIKETEDEDPDYCFKDWYYKTSTEILNSNSKRNLTTGEWIFIVIAFLFLFKVIIKPF